MTKQMLLVLTNAVAGRDDEFNDWYDNTHLADVLKIPGIVAATRFKLGDVQRMDPPYAFRYLAIYEIDTDDIASIIRELKERGGTEVMPLSSSLDAVRQALFFEKISEMRRPS